MSDEYTKTKLNRIYAGGWSLETYNGSVLGQNSWLVDYNHDGVAEGYYSPPTWRERIKQGLGCVTQFDAGETQVKTFLPVHCVNEKRFSPTLIHRKELYQPDYLDYSQIESTSLMDAADMAARAAAYRKLSASFKGLTFLGELREAVRMIKNPAAGLRKGVQKYMDAASSARRKTGGLTRRARHREYRKAASELWLEYNFGWNPLRKDLQDGLDACRDLVDRPLQEKFSVRQMRDRRFERTNVKSYYSASCNFDVMLTDVHQAYCQYYGATNVDKGWSCAAQTFGFWPAEFVPTAWELLPYSFVIDYFTNIGDVLDSWATAQRTDFAWAGVTRRYLRFNSVEVDASPRDGWDFQWLQRGKASYVRKSVHRNSVIGQIPLPLPRVDIHLNFKRGLNLGALTQARDRDRRWRR